MSAEQSTGEVHFANRIVSREEWLKERLELLAREKELTRQKDALAESRRNHPLVRVEKDYRFEGPHGELTLRDLFQGMRQLIVFHFMFEPAWEEGCPSCSHFLDNVSGIAAHLAARDTSFVVVSRAPIAKIESFRKRMGWNVPWVSSFGSDFNYDFNVTLDPEKGAYLYNFAPVGDLLAAKKIWFPKGEMPGLSVFVRDAGTVLHSYSVYQRGLENPMNTYTFLDMTPLGRQEGSTGQAWIRHHDKYPVQPSQF